MNRACAVIITVGGLLAATCASAGEVGTTKLTVSRNLMRPSTPTTLVSQRAQFSVKILTTRVIKLPRANLAGRNGAMRASQLRLLAAPVVTLPAAGVKSLPKQDETTAPKS